LLTPRPHRNIREAVDWHTLNIVLLTQEQFVGYFFMFESSPPSATASILFRATDMYDSVAPD
jgi:hypothetical protein